MILICGLALAQACSDDKGGKDAAAPDESAVADAGDVAAPDQLQTDVPEKDAPAEELPAPKPKCLEQVEAARTLDFPGLDGPVEVVFDKWGVPHIYAASEKDLFMAEGYIVARYRLVQMHAMRRIASGNWASTPIAGAGDLNNDVYMRLLGLRHVAEEIWEGIEGKDPEVQGLLENFSAGVNAYLAAAKSGAITPPLEFGFVGEIEPWTPVDSLTIGRLQSWDLSFEGRSDKVANAVRLQELTARWQGTPIAGLAADLHPLAPATKALAVPEAERQAGEGLPLSQAVLHAVSRFKPGYFASVFHALEGVPLYSGADMISNKGSNNWTVAGKLSESGHAMLANDTHLSLRNPPVFLEIHLNTTRAGGDLDLAGVCFPGIPGIILGRNAHAAWGGTVYYADATDVYVESVTPGDPGTVELDGKQVPIAIRTETFNYAKPAEGCESWFSDFIKGTQHKVEEKEGACLLTVSIKEVPHHGPVIPGSEGEDAQGKPIALTWRWTGFEPSQELKAVYGFFRMKTPEEFLAALEHFKVGAQNWVYADDAGRIAYSAFCRIPVRKNLAEQSVANPPFLPYPGTGCCEWTGDVPLADMPQAVDPERGYIFSANGDALGYTLDNDPIHDKSYQGYMFDIGFRAQRVQDLIEAKLAGGKKLSVAHLQEIQADHVSPMGELLAQHVVAAIDAAVEAKDGKTGADPTLVPFVDDQLLAAKEYLSKWDYRASSGMQDGATQQEKDNSVAASIFNAWLVFFSKALLADKMESPYPLQFEGRFLVNLFQYTNTLTTYDPALMDSLLWDNQETQEVESRNFIILKGLKDALDFLASPDQVGVKSQGGFGTADMTAWSWGKLHTVTLKSSLGGEANIPPESKLPEGFPRPGDNFAVDASDPGVSDTNFTFTSGPAIRNVYTMKAAAPEAQVVIPGGEDAAAFAPHYSDLMDLWVANQTHPLHPTPEALLPDAEACWVLRP
jgi:penicillin amidase